MTEAPKPEPARLAVLRLALAGKCRLDIGAALKLPLHKVSKHIARLKLEERLTIDVPVSRVGPPRCGEALRQALSEGRRNPATAIPRNAPKLPVTANDMAMIADFLARQKPTLCPPRYADGAVPEPEQRLLGSGRTGGRKSRAA